MKKILIALIGAFLLLQFFQIDKTNPPVDQNSDFLTLKKTPENVAQLIKSACYDCHSNETVYPWYANVQPFGWFLKDHIDEGRKKLNFSTFANYEPKRQAKKLDETAELIENGGMPLESYTLIHKEAKLTAEQKKLLVDYFNTIKNNTTTQNSLPETDSQHNEH